MKINVEATLVLRAQSGELVALEAVLRQIQAPVYNLAVRMLGRRDDAQDATQEILLRVTTHLGGWRGDSAFGTWVYSIAGNHLINARSRSPHRHEISFDELGEQLDRGLAYAERIGFNEHVLTPEDKLEARRTALSCTQAMLTCLDAPGRLAYVLDEIFWLESPAAAEVQGITPAAHRQRLARARQAVHGFMAGRCGLVSSDAPCRCVRQSPGKQAAAARGREMPGLQVDSEELDAASHALQELTALGDAAALLRGAPEFKAPDAMLQGIRLVIAQSGMLRQ